MHGIVCESYDQISVFINCDGFNSYSCGTRNTLFALTSVISDHFPEVMHAVVCKCYDQISVFINCDGFNSYSCGTGNTLFALTSVISGDLSEV